MIIDLSLPIKNNTPEPESPKITYLDHSAGARSLIAGANRLINESGRSCPELTEALFPSEMGLANEELELDAHAGTHMDAPWHFGPFSGEKKAMTIDEIPLDWCYSDGVILDLRHKSSGESITENDIKKAVNKIDYMIKPMDIVLIMTGSDRYFETDKYFSAHPGMSREATRYIIEQGVKIIGIDAWGFDRPAMHMLSDYINTGDNSYIFPSHFEGREKEYCHIEKLCNLDKVPRPTDFKVVCFPVKIENASAGWCRVAALL